MLSILKKALAAHPFEPITVISSDGSSLVIQHPEFAAVLRKAGVLYVELPEEEEPRFVSLRLIKEVRTKLAPYGLDEDESDEE